MDALSRAGWWSDRRRDDKRQADVEALNKQYELQKKAL